MQPSKFFDRAAGTRIVRASLLVSCAAALTACQDSAAPITSEAATSMSASVTNGQGRKIDDEYIVVLDGSTTDVTGRANALLKAHGGQLRHAYSHALKGFSAHMTAKQAEELAGAQGVSVVEQDQEYSVADVQYFPGWSLDRIDQNVLPLDNSYSYAYTGAGVNVYIIDTGIRRTHSQFGGRVVPAYSSVADAYGPDGCHYHGTHVAGTVGGATVGVARGATLHSVRVLDCSGNGTVSQIIAGVDWVSANKRFPAVANMSISGGYSFALNSAVASSINSGVTYVVAAGNAATDACMYSPASEASAITVGATTNTDVQAGFSNGGPCVDLFAPGNAVYSAWNTDDNSFGTSSGTSMAAPHVAGAAALYLQSNPGAVPATVAFNVVGNTTTGALTGLLSGSPNRMLRVNGSGGAVSPPPTAPPPPPPPTTTNQAPVASFNVSCSRNVCSFYSTSTDDAGVVSYSWVFGDGSTGSGSGISHTYPGKGNYTVGLTVRDAAGLSGTAYRTVNVKQGR